MKDGGQAFPRAPTGEDFGEYGMSLRDWFAGKALNGFCSNAELHGKDVGMWLGDAVARDAYSYADAMIAERSKE